MLSVRVHEWILDYKKLVLIEDRSVIFNFQPKLISQNLPIIRCTICKCYCHKCEFMLRLRKAKMEWKFWLKLDAFYSNLTRLTSFLAAQILPARNQKKILLLFSDAEKISSDSTDDRLHLPRRNPGIT